MVLTIRFVMCTVIVSFVGSTSIDNGTVSAHIENVELKQAKIENHPYHVIILGNNNLFDVCGGALISSEYILTTVSCVIRRRTSVAVGISNLNGDNIDDVLIKIPEENKFYSKTRNLALLKLEKNLIIGSKIKPIEFESESKDSYVGKSGVISTVAKNKKMYSIAIEMIPIHFCVKSRNPAVEICGRETKASNSTSLGRIPANIGSPLVADNKLIGMVRRRFNGRLIRLYKVAPFGKWIKSIMQGKTLEDKAVNKSGNGKDGNNSEGKAKEENNGDVAQNKGRETIVEKVDSSKKIIQKVEKVKITKEIKSDLTNAPRNTEIMAANNTILAKEEVEEKRDRKLSKLDKNSTEARVNLDPNISGTKSEKKISASNVEENDKVTEKEESKPSEKPKTEKAVPDNNQSSIVEEKKSSDASVDKTVEALNKDVSESIIKINVTQVRSAAARLLSTISDKIKEKTLKKGKDENGKIRTETKAESTNTKNTTPSNIKEEKVPKIDDSLIKEKTGKSDKTTRTKTEESVVKSKSTIEKSEGTIKGVESPKKDKSSTKDIAAVDDNAEVTAEKTNSANKIPSKVEKDEIEKNDKSLGTQENIVSTKSNTAEVKVENTDSGSNSLEKVEAKIISTKEDKINPVKPNSTGNKGDMTSDMVATVENAAEQIVNTVTDPVTGSDGGTELKSTATDNNSVTNKTTKDK